MSGHSKWATTHRQKEAKDAKRGAVFTKLAANITLAVRQGGGVTDPGQNFRLRLTMDKAREANMPKDNIVRAIERGSGNSGGNTLEEARFEGFLPGGVAILVDVLTDNKLRTAQQVRLIVDKSGGSMGGSGAVAYLFSQVGEVVADVSGKEAEESELAAIDCGAVEVEVLDNRMYITTNPAEVFRVRECLEKAGFGILSSQLAMRPTNLVEVADEDKKTALANIVEKIEEIDEVVNVWTNYA